MSTVYYALGADCRVVRLTARPHRRGPIDAVIAAELWRDALAKVDAPFRDMNDWMPLLGGFALPADERLLALDLFAQLLDTFSERLRWRERSAAAGAGHAGVGPHRIGYREAYCLAALRAGKRDAFRRHLRSWAAARGAQAKPRLRPRQAGRE